MNNDKVRNCIDYCNSYCMFDKIVFMHKLKHDPHRDFFDFKYRDILLHHNRLHASFRERCVDECLKKWLDEN